MSVTRIRQQLQTAKQNDGKVDQSELDKAALEARADGKIDAAEKAELQRLSGDSSVDQSRLSEHLKAMSEDAFVGAGVKGSVKNITGRYATMTTAVKGIDAKVGLFDNVLGLEGKATAAGTLSVAVEGKLIKLKVAKGETAAAVLERVKAQLPEGVRGRVFGGEINTSDPAKFEGITPERSDKTAHIAMYKPQSLELRPGERPLKVMITGYGPFPGVPQNPSGELVKQLAAMGIRGADVSYEVLPVTHAGVDEFIKRMKENPPDVVVSTGVSSAAQVEPRGQNWKASYPDANGNSAPEGEITPGLGDLPTALPQDEIAARLKKTFGDMATINAKTTAPDTSAYLCNYMNFRLLEAFPNGSKTTAGFVHIIEKTLPEQVQTIVEAAVARRLELNRAAADSVTPPNS